jgi:hypothetical protein
MVDGTVGMSVGETISGLLLKDRNMLLKISLSLKFHL